MPDPSHRSTLEPSQAAAPGCLLVALNADPFSAQLVLEGQALAQAARLPWLAVYVHGGEALGTVARERLRQHFDLAAAYGAEVLTLQDVDPLRALRALVRERPVARVLMGGPRPSVWGGGWAPGQALMRGLSQMEGLRLHVLARPAPAAPRWSWPQGSGLQYWYSLWITAGLSLVSFMAAPLFGYRGVGFFFLCALLLQSLVLPLGPLFLGALLSALVWDFFFIPPHFNLAISNSDDAFMIGAFFVAALTTGLLTSRIRRDQEVLAARGRRSELLLRLVHAMAVGKGKQPLREIAERLKGALRRDFMVFLCQPGGKLAAGWEAGQAFPLWQRDLKAAQWSLEQQRPCGWSTRQFPHADALYVPLVGKEGVVGLLVCRPLGLPFFTFEEEDLLAAACTQLALWLEREQLEERSLEAARLRESELLHQALLNSLSHELRTPLTALLGSAAALHDGAALADRPRREGLLRDLAEAGGRLNRVIDNLLDMARLSSGRLTLKWDWQDPAELVHLTLQRLSAPLAGHPVRLDVPADLPLVRIDYRLMEHALANLLLNAATYSPAGGPITVSVRAQADRLEWTVADEGAGIPEADLLHLFDKFYRVAGSPAGGLGLGLNIVRSLVAAHGGEASVRNLAPHGAEFKLSLPLTAAPPLEEAVA